MSEWKKEQKLTQKKEYAYIMVGLWRFGVVLVL